MTVATRNYGTTNKKDSLPFIRSSDLARKGILVFKKARKPNQATASVYSDRLWQEDNQKYSELCVRYFPNAGTWWSQRKIADIENFLSDFLGRKIILTAVYQYENCANGVPYWRFDYRHRYPTKKKKGNK